MHNNFLGPGGDVGVLDVDPLQTGQFLQHAQHSRVGYLVAVAYDSRGGT